MSPPRESQPFQFAKSLNVRLCVANLTYEAEETSRRWWPAQFAVPIAHIASRSIWSEDKQSQIHKVLKTLQTPGSDASASTTIWTEAASWICGCSQHHICNTSRNFFTSTKTSTKRVRYFVIFCLRCVLLLFILHLGGLDPFTFLFEQWRDNCPSKGAQFEIGSRADLANAMKDMECAQVCSD